jgi:hypothetical protein
MGLNHLSDFHEIRYGVLFFPKFVQEASSSMAVTLFLDDLNEFLPAHFVTGLVKTQYRRSPRNAIEQLRIS